MIKADKYNAAYFKPAITTMERAFAVVYSVLMDSKKRTTIWKTPILEFAVKHGINPDPLINEVALDLRDADINYERVSSFGGGPAGLVMEALESESESNPRSADATWREWLTSTKVQECVSFMEELGLIRRMKFGRITYGFILVQLCVPEEVGEGFETWLPRGVQIHISRAYSVDAWDLGGLVDKAGSAERIRQRELNEQQRAYGTATLELRKMKNENKRLLDEVTVYGEATWS